VIVLCSDLTLRFYHCSARASPNDETIKCRGAVRLRDPSFRLAWWAGSVLEGPHEGSRLCFLVGPRKDVDVLCMEPFDGFNRDVKMPSIARLPSLVGHTDAVMDAIVLDQPREVYIPSSRKEMSREVGLLATCSLDKTIRLWHLPSLREVWCLTGHISGVRSLSYDRHQSLLVSCGFEYTVRGWGVTGFQAFPLFTLEGGHNASVRVVRCAPGGAALCVSLDDDGVMSWWDTSRDSVASPTERLTHSITLNEETCLIVEPVGCGVDVDAAEDLFRSFSIERAEQLLRGDEEEIQEESEAQKLIKKRHSGADNNHTKRALADAATAGAAMAYSSNALSLACGGKRGVVRWLDAADHRDAEAPATHIDYSPRTHSIMTAHDSSLKLWDARTGLLVHEEVLEDSLVSGLSFDSRGRRCIVTDRNGTIKIRRATDGAELMYLGSHKAECSALAYCPLDRIVVTAGWDRALHVYDELEDDPQDSLVRFTEHAHDGDILHLCLSRDEGLICTSDRNGRTKLWDFETLMLLGECFDGDGSGLPEASSLHFIKPYPCLVHTDDDSGIRLIPTKTRRSALRFENGKAARIDGELRRGAAATCSQSFVDLQGGKELAPGIYSGRVLVFTGDSRGAIQAFDVQDALKRLNIEAVPSPKWQRMGYNPRRKLSRDHALSEVNDMVLKPSRNYPIRSGLASYTCGRWHAHDASVTCITVTADPPRLISCSVDGSIKAWTLDGEPVGTLTFGRDADHRALRNLAAPGRLSVSQKLKASSGVAWRFLSGKDVRRRKEATLLRARTILREIVETKRRERLQQKEARELEQARMAARERLDEASIASYESDAAKESERTRLIHQLEGEQTWVESEFDRLKAQASEAHREKAKAKKGKRRRKKKKPEDESMLSLDDTAVPTEEERAKEEALRKELKKNEMRQDPADPDNWNVGSLNRERAMYPAHHVVLEERGAKEAAKKTVKVKTAAMLTAEAEAVKHLVEPSSFFKEQFGRENRFGATGEQSVVAFKELQRTVRTTPAPPVVVASAPPSQPASSEYASETVDESVRTWGDCTFGNVNRLPPLTENDQHARTVADTLERWQKRVDGYAKLVDEKTEKSFVARVHEPLRNKLRPKRTKKVAAKPKLDQKGPSRKKRTTARGFYGPYPFSNIDAFVKAYEAALPPESKFGAPAPLDKVEKHETVQGIDYLRQRALIVAEDQTKTALSLKGFLRGYFPLIKPSELAECLDVCLARRGVGPFAKKDDELRAVFALFDVESRGAISLMDVRNAVQKGGSGLSEADAGDWPKLAGALEAKIGTIADGEIGFEAFARIVEGALRRDDEDDV
jgi:WD40 repeat protein